METATVSPKYQVVIPARVRRALGLRPGQEVQAIPYEGRIELIPDQAHQAGAGVPEGERHISRAGARQSMNVVDSSGWLEYLADGSNDAFLRRSSKSRRT